MITGATKCSKLMCNLQLANVDRGISVSRSGSNFPDSVTGHTFFVVSTCRASHASVRAFCWTDKPESSITSTTTPPNLPTVAAIFDLTAALHMRLCIISLTALLVAHKTTARVLVSIASGTVSLQMSHFVASETAPRSISLLIRMLCFA